MYTFHPSQNYLELLFPQASCWNCITPLLILHNNNIYLAALITQMNVSDLNPYIQIYLHYQWEPLKIFQGYVFNVMGFLCNLDHATGRCQSKSWTISSPSDSSKRTRTMSLFKLMQRLKQKYRVLPANFAWLFPMSSNFMWKIGVRPVKMNECLVRTIKFPNIFHILTSHNPAVVSLLYGWAYCPTI